MLTLAEFLVLSTKDLPRQRGRGGRLRVDLRGGVLLWHVSDPFSRDVFVSFMLFSVPGVWSGALCSHAALFLPVSHRWSQGVLRGLDYMGTTVFAISGTVTAGQVGMDLLGEWRE